MNRALAMGYTLPVNRVLQFCDRAEDERLYRLIAVLPQSDEAVVFGLNEGNGRPVWMQYSLIAQGVLTQAVSLDAEDPSDQFMRPDSQLSESETAERDRRYMIIEPLVSSSSSLILYDEHRGSLIAKRALEARVQRNKLYHYLRLWWRHGQIPNALVPQFSKRGMSGVRLTPGVAKRGRPRLDLGDTNDPGINIDEETKEKLLHGIAFLRQGFSYPQAFKKVLGNHFLEETLSDGIRARKVRETGIPTIDQFRYHLGKELHPGDILRANLGEAKFARKYRARVDTARDAAFGPASVYQMDATIGNFYLRSKGYPDRVIGRPVIYFIVDHYSRLIVGLHIDLSGPSWEAAKMALEMAFTEKVSYCARFGVEITEDMWPTSMCKTLMGDRGWEYIGKSAKSAASALGYSIKALPPYRPDYKALVEGRFEMVDHDQIKWMSGATYPLSRGDKKRKLDMVHTIESFTKMMIHWVLHYNQTHRISDPPLAYRSASGANPTPFEVWNHGVENYGGIRTLSRDFIRANLLHVGTGRESDRGLRFNQLFYIPSGGGNLENFVRTPGRKWREVTIKYDPRDVSKILVPGKGANFEEFILSNSSCQYAGFTLEEVRDDMQQVKTASAANFIPDLNKRLALEETQRTIEDEARAEMGGVANVARVPSPNREERRHARREIQRQQTWTSSPSIERARAPVSVSAEAPLRAEPVPANAPSYVLALQAARAKRKLLEGQK